MQCDGRAHISRGNLLWTIQIRQKRFAYTHKSPTCPEFPSIRAGEEGRILDSSPPLISPPMAGQDRRRQQKGVVESGERESGRTAELLCRVICGFLFPE